MKLNPAATIYTLREGVEFLALNGLDRSLAWLKVRVYLGTVPSEVHFGRRLVTREALAALIKKEKMAA